MWKSSNLLLKFGSGLSHVGIAGDSGRLFKCNAAVRSELHNTHGIDNPFGQGTLVFVGHAKRIRYPLGYRFALVMAEPRCRRSNMLARVMPETR